MFRIPVDDAWNTCAMIRQEPALDDFGDQLA